MPAPDENLVSTSKGYRRHKLISRWENYDEIDPTYWTNTTLTRNLATSSVQTPGFRTTKRRNLPINPYSKSVDIRSDPAMEVLLIQDNIPFSVWEWYWDLRNCATIVPGVLDPITLADDPSQRAILKLIEQCNSSRTNTLVSAAEMHKTADMVAKTATRIFEAVKSLKKGDVRGFTKALGLSSNTKKVKRSEKRRPPPDKSNSSHMDDWVANTWLEFSYGWKPLLSDIYDHAKALAELQIERANLVRYAVGSARTELKSSVPISVTGFSGRKSQTSKRYVRFGVAYKLQNGELNTFVQLGINNPLAVAWEIIPFSFVVDWFLPVGSFLESLGATAGLVFHGGFKASRDVVELETTVNGDGRKNNGGSAYYEYQCKGKATRFKMDIVRQRLLDFPSASFPQFKDPRSGQDYGLKRALSAIALLHGLR